MKTWRVLSAIVLLVVALLSGYSSAAAANPGARAAARQAMLAEVASIPDTEVSILHSEITDIDYRIYVGYPRDYADPGNTVEYPVVFLLDGNWHFATATSAFEAYNAGELPGVILVGIGYPVDDDFDCIPLREVDLLPGVGADAFLAFIQEELMPYIDANYRTDGVDRTLVGHSYGGLFTLYALFTAPETFQRYLALSPALWYGPNWDGERIIFDLEQEFFEAQDTSHPVLEADLFLAVGENEPDDVDWGFTQPLMVSNLIELSKTLKRRHYEGLDMDTVIIDELGHMGSFPGALARGLYEVYR
jgi:hypothetical protein